MDLDTLLETGEKLYLRTYKAKLEKEFLGFYFVLDVENDEYVVAEDKLKAFELATQKFGEDRLFFGVQIGDLNESVVNFKENASLSWAV